MSHNKREGAHKYDSIKHLIAALHEIIPRYFFRVQKITRLSQVSILINIITCRDHPRTILLCSISLLLSLARSHHMAATGNVVHQSGGHCIHPLLYLPYAVQVEHMCAPEPKFLHIGVILITWLRDNISELIVSGAGNQPTQRGEIPPGTMMNRRYKKCLRICV